MVASRHRLLQAAGPTISPSSVQFDYSMARKRCGCEHKAAPGWFGSFRYRKSFSRELHRKPVSSAQVQLARRARECSQPFASAHGLSVTSSPGACTNRGEALTTLASSRAWLVRRSKLQRSSVSDEALWRPHVSLAFANLHGQRSSDGETW